MHSRLRGRHTAPGHRISLSWRVAASLALLLAGVVGFLLLVQRSQVPVSVQSQVGSENSLQPTITLESVDGGTLAVARKPRQPLILYFMAAWCTACVPEATALADIYRQYARQGLQVIAIDVDPDETAQNVLRFRTLVPKADYLWAIDRWGEATRAFQVRYLDTTLAIDTNGNTVFRDEVPTDYNTLNAVVKRILKGSSADPGCC